MENPAFLDSDQSVYDIVQCSRSLPSSGAPQGYPLQCYTSPPTATNTVVIMSQRRPHHLPAIHRAHPTIHGIATSHGIPATAHLHGGRVVGVTGVPGIPLTTSGGLSPQGSGLYPDPALPPMYPVHHLPSGVVVASPSSSTSSGSSQPLYSCQAPRGHEHVYQCPGHRAGDNIDHRDHMHYHENMDPRQSQQHMMDHRERHLESRERLESREHLEQHEQIESLDQRPDYHYGGSDYSSTEPIYAQPHLHPHETSHTTLSYTNPRASLRTTSATGSLSNNKHHGTPARFLVRTDSTGASTSSSTLPTVSALLSSDLTHTQTHVNDMGKGAVGSVSSTPAKLKRQGMLRAWRVKFLRGEGGSRKACFILIGLLFLLLIFAALGTVLYLTLGGGLGAFVGESPKLIESTKSEDSIVMGRFSITNEHLWSDMTDPSSEGYRNLARRIEDELNKLFGESVWSREFNRSQVIDLSGNPLIVTTRIILNAPDVDAPKNLGAVFLRALLKRHGQEWLGRFIIDADTIKFAAELEDPVTTTTTQRNHVLPKLPDERPSSVEGKKEMLLFANAGWSEWGPWSRCSPCSPQFDQIRRRECRLDHGKGRLITKVEPCLKKTGNEPRSELLLINEGMETRPCQCNQHNHGRNHHRGGGNSHITTTTTEDPQDGFQLVEEDNIQEIDDPGDGLCDSCPPGEVCVAQLGEPYPTCRLPRDPDDPTGCGGLCAIETEMCQIVKARAFKCLSASDCLPDEWRCADGLCIPLMKRCNGLMNCYDESDESSCQCASNEFQCGNNTSCLPLTSKCDGKVDCWDGSDEANCTSVDNASQDSNSATDWKTAQTDLMNRLGAKDNANPTNFNAGIVGASQLPPSVMGGTRVATAVMNRTAIGLSSLSHRERELLS